jgi:alanine-alpha-ketoisovalerate/valine-pyruvate aminotransferase
MMNAQKFLKKYYARAKNEKPQTWADILRTLEQMRADGADLDVEAKMTAITLSGGTITNMRISNVCAMLYPNGNVEPHILPFSPDYHGKRTLP